MAKKKWMSELQLGDLNYIWNAPQPGEGHKTKASKNHDSLPEYCASESLGPMMMKDMTRTLSTLQKKTNPSIALLGGGFKYWLFSRLSGEDSHFDLFICQRCWNHQLVLIFIHVAEIYLYSLKIHRRGWGRERCMKNTSHLPSQATRPQTEFIF